MGSHSSTDHYPGVSYHRDSLFIALFKLNVIVINLNYLNANKQHIGVCVSVAEIRSFLSAAYIRLGLFTKYLLTTRHWPRAKDGKC